MACICKLGFANGLSEQPTLVPRHPYVLARFGAMGGKDSPWRAFDDSRGHPDGPVQWVTTCLNLQPSATDALQTAVVRPWPGSEARLRSQLRLWIRHEVSLAYGRGLVLRHLQSAIVM
jgi:hypothetical protein